MIGRKAQVRPDGHIGLGQDRLRIVDIDQRILFDDRNGAQQRHAQLVRNLVRFADAFIEIFEDHDNDRSERNPENQRQNQV